MHCINCGAKLDNDSKFCSACGHAVSKGVVIPMTTPPTPTEASALSSGMVNAAPHHAQPTPTEIGGLNVAKQSDRFLNLVLDWVGIYFFGFTVGFGGAIVGYSDLIKGMNEQVLGIILFATYFLFFEGIWQKSPAKWITKTRVVMKDGSKPKIGNIFWRTLARFIPFEAFSFLGSKTPIGWHDSLSKTIVITEK